MEAISEQLEAISKLKTKKDKQAALARLADQSTILKPLIECTYNPRIKWLLPEGAPPYTPSKEDGSLLGGRLYQEWRMIKHFLNTGPHKNMPAIKRENLFISLLQTVHQKDAELLVYIKDHRRLPYSGMTKKLVSEVFTTMAQNWKEDEVLN